ncbi:MAG: SNF2-related protein [Elusimicrobiota bacterium]
MKESVAYRMGNLSFGSYYQGLKNLCNEKGISLDKTPSFNNYIRYVLLSDGIKAEPLLKSVRSLEEEIVERLAKTNEEKELINLSRQLTLTEKLVDFSLTPNEWEEYKKHSNPLIPTVPLSSLSGGEGQGEEGLLSSSSHLTPHPNPLPKRERGLELAPFEQFYREADIRSEKMVFNLLSKIEILNDKSQNSNNIQKSNAKKINSLEFDIWNLKIPKPKVLVVGGFHTPHVTKLLRENNVPYIVVSPKISKVETEKGSEYLTVFSREKTPLDKLFKAEKLFVNPTTVNSKAIAVKIYGSLSARILNENNFFWKVGKRFIQFHVNVFNKTDAIQDEVKPKLSITEKLYLIFGVNWEMVFQLMIPLSLWLFPGSPWVSYLVWGVSAVVFSLFHPNTPFLSSKFFKLFFVGIILGSPFVFGSFMTSNSYFDSAILHSSHNALVLFLRAFSNESWLGKLGHLLPLAALIEDNAEKANKNKIRISKSGLQMDGELIFIGDPSVNVSKITKMIESEAKDKLNRKLLPNGAMEVTGEVPISGGRTITVTVVFQLGEKNVWSFNKRDVENVTILTNYALGDKLNKKNILLLQKPEAEGRTIAVKKLGLKVANELIFIGDRSKNVRQIQQMLEFKENDRFTRRLFADGTLEVTAEVPLREGKKKIISVLFQLGAKGVCSFDDKDSTGVAILANHFLGGNLTKENILLLQKVTAKDQAVMVMESGLRDGDGLVFIGSVRENTLKINKMLEFKGKDSLSRRLLPDGTLEITAEVPLRGGEKKRISVLFQLSSERIWSFDSNDSIEVAILTNHFLGVKLTKQNILLPQSPEEKVRTVKVTSLGLKANEKLVFIGNPQDIALIIREMLEFKGKDGFTRRLLPDGTLEVTAKVPLLGGQKKNISVLFKLGLQGVWSYDAKDSTEVAILTNHFFAKNLTKDNILLLQDPEVKDRAVTVAAKGLKVDDKLVFIGVTYDLVLKIKKFLEFDGKDGFTRRLLPNGTLEVIGEVSMKGGKKKNISVIFQLGFKGVWSFNPEDAPIIAQWLNLRLRPTTRSDIKALEEHELLDILWLLKSNNSRLFIQIVRRKFPHLNPAQINALVQSAIRGLSGKRAGDDVRYELDDTLTLDIDSVSPTIEKEEIFETSETLVTLKGRAPPNAQINVFGPLRLQAVVSEKGEWTLKLPLILIGQLNTFQFQVLDTENNKIGPIQTLNIQQTSALNEALSDYAEDHSELDQDLLSLNLEKNFLRYFTKNEQAGFDYLKGLVEKEKKAALKKIYQRILDKFEEVRKINPIFKEKEGDPYTLYFYQKWVLHEILTRYQGKNVLLALEQGLGKSLIVLALTLILSKPALVFSPNALTENWVRESDKFLNKPFSKLEGKQEERVQDLKDRNVSTTVNIELLRYLAGYKASEKNQVDADLLKNNLEIIRNLKDQFGFAAVDESDRVTSSNESQQVQGAKLISQNLITLLLSGTPFGNLEQAKHMLETLGIDVSNIDLNDAGAREMLQELLIDNMIRLTKDMLFETADPNIPIEDQLNTLPAKEFKAFTFKASRDQMQELKESFDSDEDPGKKRDQYKRILKKVSDAESPKSKLLDSILREKLKEKSTNKVVIFVEHREDAEILAKRYKEFGARIYMGGQADENAESYRLFREDANTRIIIGTYDSMAAGLTLPADMAILFGHNGIRNRLQAIDRIHRIGVKRHKVEIVDLVSQYDQDFLDGLPDKEKGLFGIETIDQTTIKRLEDLEFRLRLFTDGGIGSQEEIDSVEAELENLPGFRNRLNPVNPESLTLDSTEKFAEKLGFDPQGKLTQFFIAPFVTEVVSQLLPGFLEDHSKRSWQQKWIGLPLIYGGAVMGLILGIVSAVHVMDVLALMTTMLHNLSPPYSIFIELLLFSPVFKIFLVVVLFLVPIWFSAGSGHSLYNIIARIQRNRGKEGWFSLSKSKVKVAKEFKSDFRDQKLLKDVNPTAIDWKSQTNDWNISDLIYCPTTIKTANLVNEIGVVVGADAFGNFPKWVYRITHLPSKKIFYVGPDDVLQLFPEEESRVQLLRSDKEKELKSAYERFVFSGKIIHWMGLDIASKVYAIGKETELTFSDLENIDIEFQKVVQEWKKKVDGIDLGEFQVIVTDLHRLEASLRSRRLRVVPWPDVQRVLRVLRSIDEEKNEFNFQDVIFLKTIHQRLLSYQNSSILEAISWANRKATAVNIDIEAKTPAFQANLWVARWVIDHIKTNKTVLDIGANLSVLWRVYHALKETNENGDPHSIQIIDLEKDPNIYGQAPNPLRVRADISRMGSPTKQVLDEINTPKIVDGFFDSPHQVPVIAASFVLDQLEPQDLRDALREIDNLLVLPPVKEIPLNNENLDQFPLLILTSPEHAPIGNSNLDDILKEMGYEPVYIPHLIKNELNSSAKDSLKSTLGSKAAKNVEEFTSKPYHAAVYAKVRVVDPVFVKIPLARYTFRQPQKRRSQKNRKTDEKEEAQLDPSKLESLFYIESLRPTDFNISETSIIPRTTIYSLRRYRMFELNIAILSHYYEFLNVEDKNQFDAIKKAWDDDNSAFLTTDQVNFVMDRPTQLAGVDGWDYEQVLGEFNYLRRAINEYRDSYKARRLSEIYTENKTADMTATERRVQKELEEQKYSLRQIFDWEEAWRSANNGKNIIEETRDWIGQRIIQIHRAVIKLRDEKKSVSPTTVGAEIRVVYATVINFAKSLNVDLSSWDIIVEGAARVDVDDRKSQILNAVDKIKLEKGEPNLGNVAQKLGLKRHSLSGWFTNAKVDPVSLGVIPQKFDVEARKKEIVEAVAELVKEEKKPTRAAVQERIGVTTSLATMAKSEGIDLASLGVERDPVSQPVDNQKRIELIKKAVEDIIKEGNTPNVRTVAFKIGLKGQKTLSDWAERHNVDLAALGVIVKLDKTTRIKQIKKAVREIKKANGIPNAVAVKKKAGFSDATGMREWAKRNDVDLASLGVIEETKEEKEKEIRDIVAKLISEGKSPNFTAAGIALGYGATSAASALQRWAQHNGINLTALGVVDYREEGHILDRTVSLEDSLLKIRTAVEDIKSQNKRPYFAAVAAQLGYSGRGGGAALHKWLQTNEINPAALGIVYFSDTDTDSDAGSEFSNTSNPSAPGSINDKFNRFVMRAVKFFGVGTSGQLAVVGFFEGAIRQMGLYVVLPSAVLGLFKFLYLNGHLATAPPWVMSLLGIIFVGSLFIYTYLFVRHSLRYFQKRHFEKGVLTPDGLFKIRDLQVSKAATKTAWLGYKGIPFSLLGFLLLAFSSHSFWSNMGGWALVVFGMFVGAWNHAKGNKSEHSEEELHKKATSRREFLGGTVRLAAASSINPFQILSLTDLFGNKIPEWGNYLKLGMNVQDAFLKALMRYGSTEEKEGDMAHMLASHWLASTWKQENFSSVREAFSQTLSREYERIRKLIDGNDPIWMAYYREKNNVLKRMPMPFHLEGMSDPYRSSIELSFLREQLNAALLKVIAQFIPGKQLAQAKKMAEFLRRNLPPEMRGKNWRMHLLNRGIGDGDGALEVSELIRDMNLGKDDLWLDDSTLHFNSVDEKLRYRLAMGEKRNKVQIEYANKQSARLKELHKELSKPVPDKVRLKELADGFVADDKAYEVAMKQLNSQAIADHGRKKDELETFTNGMGERAIESYTREEMKRAWQDYMGEPLQGLGPDKRDSDLEILYQQIVTSQDESIKNNRYSPIEINKNELKKLVKMLISEIHTLYAGKTLVKLHPQGFLQLVITGQTRWENSGGLRFHVWDPSLPRTPEVFDGSHKHSFQSNSFVLLGEVGDTIEYTVPVTDGLSGEQIFRKYRTPLRDRITPMDELVHVRSRLSRSAPAGSRLYYPIGDFHSQKIPSGIITATLFQKYGLDENNPAIAIGPQDVPESINEMNQRIVDQEVAWRSIFKAVKELEIFYELDVNDTGSEVVTNPINLRNASLTLAVIAPVSITGLIVGLLGEGETAGLIKTVSLIVLSFFGFLWLTVFSFIRIEKYLGGTGETGPPATELAGEPSTQLNGKLKLYGFDAVSSRGIDFLEFKPKTETTPAQFVVNPFLFRLLTHPRFIVRFGTHFFLNIFLVPIHELTHAYVSKRETVAYGVQAGALVGIVLSVIYAPLVVGLVVVLVLVEVAGLIPHPNPLPLPRERGEKGSEWLSQLGAGLVNNNISDVLGEIKPFGVGQTGQAQFDNEAALIAQLSQWVKDSDFEGSLVQGLTAKIKEENKKKFNQEEIEELVEMLMALIIAKGIQVGERRSETKVSNKHLLLLKGEKSEKVTRVAVMARLMEAGLHVSTDIVVDSTETEDEVKKALTLLRKYKLLEDQSEIIFDVRVENNKFKDATISKEELASFQGQYPLIFIHGFQLAVGLSRNNQIILFPPLDVLQVNSLVDFFRSVLVAA